MAHKINLMKQKTFEHSNYSKILDIINKSYSLAQVLKELGLKPYGGNYKSINRFIKDNNINIDHLKGKGWNTGVNHKTCSPAKPLKEVLNKNTVYQEPNQLLMRNYISKYTPYDNLLLFSGLGTGKTCTSITIAEGLKEYILNMGRRVVVLVKNKNIHKN